MTLNRSLATPTLGGFPPLSLSDLIVNQNAGFLTCADLFFDFNGIPFCSIAVRFKFLANRLINLRHWRDSEIHLDPRRCRKVSGGSPRL